MDMCEEVGVGGKKCFEYYQPELLPERTHKVRKCPVLGCDIGLQRSIYPLFKWYIAFIQNTFNPHT